MKSKTKTPKKWRSKEHLNPNKTLTKKPPISKYYRQRYSLFSKFDAGVQMDDEGWFSVTPEPIAALHASHAPKSSLVLDCFSGVGGNAIQFAARGCCVIGVEIDEKKVGFAVNNAKLYGVEDNIDFVIGDFFQLAPFLRGDVAFLSPPWGGPSYKNVPNFTLDMLKPKDGSVKGLMKSTVRKDIRTIFSTNRYSIFQAAQRITPNIMMFLPRNVDQNQVAELSWLSSPPLDMKIEENHVDNYVKGITAYFGGTASAS